MANTVVVSVTQPVKDHPTRTVEEKIIVGDLPDHSTEELQEVVKLAALDLVLALGCRQDEVPRLWRRS